MFRLKRGNFAFFVFQGATGFRTACHGQITLQLLPAPIPGCIQTSPAGHSFDLAGDRCQQIASGEARGVAAVEAGRPLTDPEKPCRTAIFRRLQGLGDPGLGVVRLLDQAAGRDNPGVAAVPTVPALLDSIFPVG